MLQSPFRLVSPSLVIALAAFSAAACGTKEGTDGTTAASNDLPVEEVQGKVKNCHDGDTCNVILADGENLTVRLSGIDAPEVSGGEDNQGQPFGAEARDYLRGLVKGKQVTVRKIGTDPYERTIGEIYLSGQLVDLMIVKKGFAEAYKWASGPIDKQAYRDAETAAKSQKIGVWSLEEYESPADFRAANNAANAE